MVSCLNKNKLKIISSMILTTLTSIITTFPSSKNQMTRKIKNPIKRKPSTLLRPLFAKSHKLEVSNNLLMKVWWVEKIRQWVEWRRKRASFQRKMKFCFKMETLKILCSCLKNCKNSELTGTFTRLVQNIARLHKAT